MIFRLRRQLNSIHWPAAVTGGSRLAVVRSFNARGLAASDSAETIALGPADVIARGAVRNQDLAEHGVADAFVRAFNHVRMEGSAKQRFIDESRPVPHTLADDMLLRIAVCDAIIVGLNELGASGQTRDGFRFQNLVQQGIESAMAQACNQCYAIGSREPVAARANRQGSNIAPPVTADGHVSPPASFCR
jgi:hypothetical protein